VKLPLEISAAVKSLGAALKGQFHLLHQPLASALRYPIGVANFF
jgi:hypothetical protein